MDWQARYYPIDVFVSLADKMAAMIAAGECLAIALVEEEINAVGTPGLRAWVKKNTGLFVALDPTIIVEASSIESKYPDLTDPKSPYQ